MAISIAAKTFPPALAFTANRFAVSFYYVPFTITGDTNHFNPSLQNSGLWSSKESHSNELGLYAGFMWLARKK